MANTFRGPGDDSQPPRAMASIPPSSTQMLDHSFTLQAVMDLKGTQGALTEAIKGLSDAIARQEKQLDKINDLRVDIGKLETNITTLTSELSSTKNRLDSVRMQVVGAVAVIAFIAFLTPIALKFWPTAPATATGIAQTPEPPSVTKASPLSPKPK